MQLSESKLFTIEALNRIEGFVWPDGAEFCQVDGGHIAYFYGDASGAIASFRVGDSHDKAAIKKTVTKAEFDSVDGWVRHDNSECPANSESPIQVQMDGFWVGKPSPPHIAKEWAWVNGGITHWRYHKPAKETTKPTAKQACIETLISKRKDALEQKRLALVALEEAEAAEHGFMLAIEAWAESHGFDIRLLDESEEKPDQQESELVITGWRDLLVGDEVIITGSLNKKWIDLKGKTLSVSSIASNGVFLSIGRFTRWFINDDCTFKFIRRPQ